MLHVLILGAVALLPQRGEDLGTRVRDLFADKCIHCHVPDSDSRKAKREFDAAWDLRAVARAWGDPMAPDFAPLYEIAEDRSMPPEDSDFEPMTVEEAKLLQEWVRALTPMPADGNPFVDLEMALRYSPVDNRPPPPPPPRNLMQRLVILTGRLHASVVHFPVAMLLLAALLRVGSRLRPSDAVRRIEFLCLLVGAPAAVLAAGLGWLNAANSGAGGEELFWHRWIGVGVTVLSLALLLLHRSASRKKWFGLLLLLLGVALAFGAHKGGVLVFGEAYLQV